MSDESNVSMEPIDEGTDVSVDQEEVVDSREAIMDMEDDEFEEHLEKLTSNDSNESSEPKENDSKEDKPVDLNELYKSRIEENIKLDTPILLKNGEAIVDVDNYKDAKDLMERGLDYTKKTQALAQYRDVIGYLEDNGLLDKEVLDRVVRGEALIEEPIQRQEQDVKAHESELLAQKILESDTAEDFRGVVSQLPDEVKDEMRVNPELMNGIFVDVQNGVAQKLMPLTQKLMAVKGLDFVSAYVEAGNELLVNGKQVNQNTDRLKNVPKSRGNQRKTKYTREDIFDMDDSDFEKYLDKL
jgi:hypothetical protein